MPSAEDRVVAAVQAFQKNHPAESFSQACERFLYYISYAANGMSDAGLSSYGSAALAQAASGPLNAGTPPAGSVAWFDIGSPSGDGRYSLGGGVLVGPTDRPVVVLKDYGFDVKQHTLASYQTAKPGARYLGWSWRNGVNVMPPISSAASVVISEFPNLEGDLMARLYLKTSSGLVSAVNIDTGFRWDVPNMDYVALLRARKLVIDEDPVPLADNEWTFLETLLRVRAFPAFPAFPKAGNVALTVTDGQVTGTVTAA